MAADGAMLVNLGEELHTALRLAAIMRGTSKNAIVRDLLRKNLCKDAAVQTALAAMPNHGKRMTEVTLREVEA